VSTFSLIGQLFDGRYRIESLLGSGGMADVYLATDQSLGRKVAIKILSDRYARDAGFVERFRREAAAAASLRHPNIVTVYDRGEAMGTSYIAMEYLDGPTLKEEITRRAPLPEPEAINYATQALAALDAAHRQGVVHRDIKPHNLVLTDEGRLKVTDFGIARAANTQQMTEVGSIVGTAQYLSPEQARGLAVGPQSDIYSMGVVLYEMLSGDLPFTGDSAVDIAMKQVSDAPPPLHSRNRLVSPAMEQVVMRALAKDPALRFQSARQMTEELARVGRGQSASSDTQQATRVIAADQTRVIRPPPPAEGATNVLRPPPPPERPAPRRSALPWLLVLVLLVLAAVAGFVVFKMLNGSDLSVPQSLVGQTCTQGLQTLQADGLKGKCVNTTSTVADVGKIVATDPSVGSGVNKGDQVTLRVGIGPKSVKVPPLKGLSILDASNLLQTDGFKVDPNTVFIDSPKAAQNFVVGSTPKEGTAQKRGATVTLKVASGFVKVPAVAGMSCADAKKALVKLTLKPSCQNRPNQAPKGQAFATSLGSVTRIAQGTQVTVFISAGPSLTTLPNVVGETAGQAKRDLHNAGFVVAVTQQVECTDPTQDHIVQSQNPSGPTAPRGSTVEITVLVYKVSDPSCVGPPGST
jgi:beta-lactam-binding protein with PASTA domain/predicted Ser/Thr protein kinase